MKKKLSALLLSCVMAASVCVPTLAADEKATDKETASVAAPAAIPAFPGAEGGGKYTSGGRGCDVYIVTNLEDYAAGEDPIPGSFRDAVSKDNRTIVFNVSGTIVLKDKLEIKGRKNITIAGQTAPGDGITLYGFETNLSDSENMIIRYLRLRPGAVNVHKGDSMDAIWGRSMKNMMFDHLSTSWSTDETMSLYRMENATVQWSIIAESLTMSGHTKGRHGYGAIWGGVNTTYHHNLVANHTSRNPRIGGGTPEADDNNHIALTDVRNNVLYNWGYNTIYGGGRSRTNYMNNYIKAGQGTRDSVRERIIDAGEKGKPGYFYVRGNYVEGNDALTKDNSKGIYVSESNAPSTEISSTEFTMEGTKPENLRTTSAKEAYPEVLAKAGATYPRRDALDARIINQVQTDTGRYANLDDEVGGYPVRDSEKRPDDFDKDKDGMADAWELENGLDPTNPDDGKELAKDNSGYTNLEKYLNSLVDMEHAPENPKIEISSLNYNQMFTKGETVTVTADVSDNDGIDKVQFFIGKEIVGEATEAPYTYKTSSLDEGTYYISAKVYDKKGNQTQSNAVAIHVNDVTMEGSQWAAADIGKVETTGATTVYSDDKITVKGSGKLIGNADTFQYAYKKLSGDGEIVVKLDSATLVDNHAFSGIMIRNDLKADSAAVALGLSATKAYEWKEKNETGKEVTYYRNAFSVYLAGRDKKGGDFSKLDENLDSLDGAKKTNISLVRDIAFKELSEYKGYYLRMSRKDDKFTAYCSPDGENWTEVGSRTIPMNNTVYIGVAAEANKVANKLVNVNTAKFSNISISGRVSKGERTSASTLTTTVAPIPEKIENVKPVQTGGDSVETDVDSALKLNPWKYNRNK